ncbi:DUF488 domain-containing protein [Kaistia defluvii]|uniref:DUF488 domain-containing protein n=1 Tax=Kaistia defluvii TaxID=410841 RepID=UPI00224EB2A6|nr:DUF488 domain-containing protein [Kaistia defluvii]MCX5519786.1 DUF488 domain-containing protein [Kaistia defluvii]
MIQLKRIYEPASPEDGFRVLVDRLWPRGVPKARAAVDLWARDVAPSTELRQWFHHEPSNWDEFVLRYRQELAAYPEAVSALREKCAGRVTTLLYGARDEARNQAVLLRELLESGDPASGAG